MALFTCRSYIGGSSVHIIEALKDYVMAVQCNGPIRPIAHDPSAPLGILGKSNEGCPRIFQFPALRVVYHWSAR